MIKKSIYIFTFLSIGLQLFSQDTLSLENAIVKGLNNNYQIQITQLETDISSNNNNWGTAGAYPTIKLNAQSLNSSSEYVDSLPLGINESQTLNPGVSIDLQWIVFNGFRVRTTRAQLADLYESSEGNAALVVESTLQSIILAYHIALLHQETLKVMEEVKKLSTDRYNYVLSKKEFGSAGTFDVLLAENNYLTDSANVLKQLLNYHNSIRNLNMVLNEPIENFYFLNSEFLIIEKEFALTDLMNKLETSNKTLKNQYVYQEILKKNVKLKQSSLYPVISLSAGVGNNWGGIYMNYENGNWGSQYGYNINLVLSWTLSNGGNIRRSIENARIEQQIGVLQIEDMKVKLSNQILSTLEDYNVKRQLRQVSKQGLKSAKLNLQIAEEKYKAGSINSFNYRDIQIVYLNAARELLQSNFNLVDSYTELLRLTGGIVDEYSAE